MHSRDNDNHQTEHPTRTKGQLSVFGETRRRQNTLDRTSLRCNRSVLQMKAMRQTVGKQSAWPQPQCHFEMTVPGDKCEQEADRAADQVLRCQRPELQMSPDDVCLKDRFGVAKLQQIPDSGFSSNFGLQVPQALLKVLTLSGHPMDDRTRGFFEPRFGYDFGHIQVHTGNEADKLAHSVNARAFTIGRHIIFGAGQYSTNTLKGRHLIAHELAHVVQNNTGGNDQREGFKNALAPMKTARTIIEGTQFQIMRRAFVCPGVEREQERHGELSDEDILNRLQWNSPEYSSAVSRWPRISPIWPILRSRPARENFVRYIVNLDLTNCRPYHSTDRPDEATECRGFLRARETFHRLCTGFAAQIFVRYGQTRRRHGQTLVTRGRRRLRRRDIRSLRDMARVYESRTPSKYRVPVFMVFGDGHAFNAFLVGSDHTDITSYLFLEPQSDKLFSAESRFIQNYWRYGTLSLALLTGFTVDETGRGQYITEHVADFIRVRGGETIYRRFSDSERVVLTQFMQILFVAERFPSWRTRVMQLQPNELQVGAYRRLVRNTEYRSRIVSLFEAYVRREAPRFSNDELAYISRFVIGRDFAKYPWGPRETLTQETYIRLIGRRV